MADVVGANGHVAASEVQPLLAERAKQNLAGSSNVVLHAEDGALVDLGTCDAILINAGVTHPLPLWLDRLSAGGAIVLPLTIPMGTEGLGKGVMVRIVRERGGYSARVVTYVAIYSCTSVRDTELEHRLAKALAKGAFMKLKSVRRDLHDSTGTCVLHAPEMCFSSEEIIEPDQAKNA
jgi:protein-L-isoaspartate(D-aspartate) O-methyltransferase